MNLGCDQRTNQLSPDEGLPVTGRETCSLLVRGSRRSTKIANDMSPDEIWP